MKFKMLALAAASLVAVAAPLAAAKPVYGDWGYNAAAMDSSVKPGDDFEAYANGAWRKTTEIPPDRSSTGVDFEVFQKAEKRNADLIKEAGAGKQGLVVQDVLMGDCGRFHCGLSEPGFETRFAQPSVFAGD